ncbi:hypothetical protein BBAD15_g11886 [Beauveria bassiana D1-5]|uniref:FAD-binding FR-type domain-containing protein n=1 Tax=Beauveria bassiana D1-5 TaxID=1245745 RepID=A0A0A2VPY5_BEABA|nr:hypothetical protein BBAD15_g11886 [Beauveria bassiana D1-5]
MDANLLYIISFLGFIVSFILLWAVKLYVANPQASFVKHILYPLAIPRLGTTRMDVLVFVIVLSSNVIVVLLPTFFPGWREIQKRSALSALVNIVPLSFGGRDVLIDALNMPRRWHRSLHIIVGIIVALEAASHATIAIVLRPRPGQLAKSGYIASGLLGGVVLLAVPFTRRCFGRWFLLAHRTTYLGSMAALLWHVMQTASSRGRLLLWLSVALWLSTSLFRVVRVSLYSTAAEVEYLSETTDALLCTVRLTRAVKLRPGCHFYLYFPQNFYALLGFSKYNLLQSFTVMALWHPTEEPRLVSSVSFLLSRHGHHATAISKLGEGSCVLLDGPYGQDLALERQENVILVAKGMGIAGVLHIALDLAIRRFHDNSVKDRIEELKRLTHPNGGMPFDQLIVSKIKEERCRLPGRMAVVVCGGSKFKRLIRSAVLECLGEELVRYVESAYQTRELAGPEAMHVGRSGAAQLREIPTISRPRKTYSIASASSLYSNK